MHRGHYHRYSTIFYNQTENDKWYFGAENCSPRVNTGLNIIEIYEIRCLCRPTISTNIQFISIEITTFLQVFSQVWLCTVKGCSQESKSLHLVPTNERFLLLGGRMAPTHCSWDKAEQWQLGLYLNIRHTRTHSPCYSPLPSLRYYERRRLAGIDPQDQANTHRERGESEGEGAHISFCHLLSTGGWHVLD